MDTDRLIQKLGLQLGQKAYTLHAPVGYTEFLHIPEPARVIDELDLELDWIQAFYTDKAVLEAEFATLGHKLAKAGQLWISWPKKTSGVASSLQDRLVRELGLAVGLVDVKITAIDETWSGLKFIYRRKDR
jgi:hypothetical protein